MSIQTDQDPKKTVHADETRPSAIVNGFSEGEHEKGSQDRKGYVHPLIQGDWSDESSPRPVGLGLNEHVIQPDSLNVAGFSDCDWPGVFLKSHRQ